MLYTLKILRPDGSIIDITPYILGMSLKEPTKQLANSVSLSIFDDNDITNLLELCTAYFLYDNTNQEIFQGTQWSIIYNDNGQQTNNITIYDRSYYLQKSKDNFFFAEGRTTESVLKEICDKWGIELSYQWESFTHSQLIFRNQTIADCILETLQDADSKLSKGFVCSMENNVLVVKNRGTNETIYQFDGNTSMTNLRYEYSMENLVTRVIITGQQDDDGRTPVESTIDGKIEYGVIQSIVSRSTNDTLEKATEEANNILKEDGNPTEEITISTVDVTKLRKGDLVRIVHDKITDLFYVTEVDHDCKEAKMTIDLERKRQDV